MKGRSYLRRTEEYGIVATTPDGYHWNTSKERDEAPERGDTKLRELFRQAAESARKKGCPSDPENDKSSI